MSLQWKAHRLEIVHRDLKPANLSRSVKQARRTAENKKAATKRSASK